MLGRVRGKFQGNLKTPDSELTMEYDTLLSEAKEEKIGVIQICDYQNRDSIRSLIGEDVLYYYGDSDVGKISIRSDPGIILLQNGIILKKWHYNNVPDLKEVQDLLN